MTYSRPRRLGFVAPDVTDGEELLIYLMPLPDGPPVVLEGSGAVIWLVASRGAEEVCDAVAGQLGVEPEEIAKDVDDYLGVLVERGLLDRAESSIADSKPGIPSLN